MRKLLFPLLFSIVSSSSFTDPQSDLLAKYNLVYQQTDKTGLLNFTKNQQSVELSKHKNYDLIQSEEVAIANDEKLLFLVWKSKVKNAYAFLEGYRFNKSLNKATRVALPKVFNSELLNGDIKLSKANEDLLISVKYQIYSYFLDDEGVFHRVSYKIDKVTGKFKFHKHKVDHGKTSHDYFNLAGFYSDHKKIKTSLKYFELALDENYSDEKQIDKAHLAHLNFEYAKALIKDKQANKAKVILQKVAQEFSDVQFGKDAKKLLEQTK
ncbi:MAG: hypothetical protein KC646_01845 [Candidatus Cloacimonetes bacterium]|nr:hypothetical protein [Candidatus Cloacimonadota bacterium]